jgi:hypothetical protein
MVPLCDARAKFNHRLPFAIGMPQTQVSHSVPIPRTSMINAAAGKWLQSSGLFGQLQCIFYLFRVPEPAREQPFPRNNAQ